MIHYHGGPITPQTLAIAVWTNRHAFVSFHRPEQVAIAAEACQTFAIDNGAFSHWRKGHGVIDVGAYKAFVERWHLHPSFDWCLIPDVVDGDERANDAMIDQWIAGGWFIRGPRLSVPVWHLHESLARLKSLCVAWQRVALGSSGQYAEINTPAWRARMDEVFSAICDGDGRPPCKLHGLRMLNNTVASRYPLASADSTNVARNHNRLYAVSDGAHALFMASRIESHATAKRWNPSAEVHFNLELVG